MFSPAAVLLVVCATLLTTPSALAFVVSCPRTMSKNTESRHVTAAVKQQAVGEANAGGAAVQGLGIEAGEGLGGLASQYDAFLIGGCTYEVFFGRR